MPSLIFEQHLPNLKQSFPVWQGNQHQSFNKGLIYQFACVSKPTSRVQAESTARNSLFRVSYTSDAILIHIYEWKDVEQLTALMWFTIYITYHYVPLIAVHAIYCIGSPHTHRHRSLSSLTPERILLTYFSSTACVTWWLRDKRLNSGQEVTSSNVVSAMSSKGRLRQALPHPQHPHFQYGAYRTVIRIYVKLLWRLGNGKHYYYIVQWNYHRLKLLAFFNWPFLLRIQQTQEMKKISKLDCWD